MESFQDEPEDIQNGLSKKPRKLEPLEMEASDERLENNDNHSEDDEALISAGGASNSGSEINIGALHALQGADQYYLGGRIKAQTIGNMQIFFPDHFNTTGWGVLGPQWFGPACVWGLLVLASHFCIHRAHRFGIVSVIICYGFFAASTYYLTDVSLRDPGICFDKDIPETVTPEEARHWKWCDFCQIYQPPGGAHCPDCNVCIAGYDHHCVWMGTCIGKRNYRQFVRFNVSWLYYLLYVFIWLITFGPIFRK